MTTDDITTPLGQNVKQKPAWLRYRLPVTMPQLLAGALGLFLLAFLGFALFNDDPFGGEPMARVIIPPLPAAVDPAKPVQPPTPAAPLPPVAQAPVIPAPPAAEDRKTVTIIDGSSGARRDVVVSSGDADGKPSGAASTVMANINPQLLEPSRYGMIPIAAGGLKPSQAYAAGTDALRTKAATMPAVAIVVGGLGIGAAKTTDAILKLPGAVTLAFTPYGTDPGKLVERARSQGHEVLLQVPLEPFDYPDNDPGPQTLLTSLAADQNLDRLTWHMSRFQGYVGFSNFMGARFVPNEASMQPLMKEAAKRGLAYFDDGLSARSVSQQLAGQSIPYAKADLTIDATPNAAEIDRALGQLETLAKQRGVAVGTASALPLSIDRLAAWSRALEGRGILLVPLTMAMAKSKSK